MGKIVRKIYISAFVDGFFYFFGLSDNPYSKDVAQIVKRQDRDALASDWHNVGKDFKVAFDKKRIHYEQSF